MSLMKVFTCILVLCGTVIMLISIHRFALLLKNKGICGSRETRGLLAFFKVHLSLMIFFLIGYLIIVYAILTGINLISDIFVGIIFFGGAIFVLLGILLQDRMLVSLRHSYVQAIKMLVSAVEIRDPYTIGHSEHVANLALLIFDHLPAQVKRDISRNQIENAGLLHDIGKIGVPEKVLNKIEKLDEDEWRMIKQHTTIGQSLIGNLDCMDDIKRWIEYHHERIDGKGYHKIRGVHIPLVSKILSTADTYSALVTDRPYRKGKTHQEALTIIEQAAGSQLDPNLVHVLHSLDQKAVEQCRPDSMIIEYMDDLKKIEHHFDDPDRSAGIDSILPENVGALCLQKIFDYCLKQKALLSLAIVEIEGLGLVDRNHGYHEADAISEKFGIRLMSNIRGTDVIVKFRRNLFLLAFPQCPGIQAMKLLDRIRVEIQKDIELLQSEADLRIRTEFLEFQPSQMQNGPEIETFIEGLSASLQGEDLARLQDVFSSIRKATNKPDVNTNASAETGSFRRGQSCTG